MQIITKPYNIDKFKTFGYIEDNFKYPAGFIDELVEREIDIYKATGFETDLSFLRIGKQRIKEKNQNLCISYNTFHPQSKRKAERDRLYYLKMYLTDHIYTKYLQEKEYKRNRRLFNKRNDYIINGSEFLKTANLIYNTFAFNQKLHSNILLIDIDNENGIKIAKDIAKLFNADFQSIEQSVTGRCHCSFIMSTYLKDKEITYLQRYLNETFNVHIDIRRTSTIMRYWNSHSYRTGRFDNEGNFIQNTTLQDHYDWQQSTLDFNGKTIDLNFYHDIFLEGKELIDFKKRNGLYHEPNSIPNIKINYDYNKTNNLFKNISNKPKANPDFYYGAGKRHFTIFKKGLGFYAYKMSGGDFEKFSEIILSYDRGSREHIQDGQVLLNRYWDFFSKNYVDKTNNKTPTGNISSYDFIYNNSDMLNPEIKSYIKRLSDYIIKKEIKHKDIKNKWLILYPKFLEIIISRELLKIDSDFKTTYSGNISRHLKNQLEDPNCYKFMSTKEYKVLKESFPEFKDFNFRKAFELFIQYLLKEKEINIQNSYSQKKSKYIPSLISKRFILKYSNTFNTFNDFISDIIFNIRYLLNEIKIKSNNKRLKTYYHYRYIIYIMLHQNINNIINKYKELSLGFDTS